MKIRGPEVKNQETLSDTSRQFNQSAVAANAIKAFQEKNHQLQDQIDSRDEKIKQLEMEADIMQKTMKTMVDSKFGDEDHSSKLQQKDEIINSKNEQI